MRQLLSILFFTIVFSSAYSQVGLNAGDITISAGFGKNRFYYDQEFEFVAPIEIPAQINFGLPYNFELGLEYTPVLFNDRSSVNLDNSNSGVRNHVQGGAHNIGGLLNYAFVNDYGMVAYVSAGGAYSILDKEHWINGRFYERHGKGYSYSGGISFRYHLGNEYDDVFPWYFDLGLSYTRYSYEIDYFKIDGKLGDSREKEWNDIAYNSLDVILRIGYRFRLKK